MNISIGTDIEEISRFRDKNREKDEIFLKKIYTDKELEYCYRSKNPAPHLCARYCAKEATVKALYDINIKDVYYSDIEISNNADGVPHIEIAKYPDLQVKITMSHCKDYATATAIIMK